MRILKEMLLVLVAMIVYIVSFIWILIDFVVGRNKEWEK